MDAKARARVILCVACCARKRRRRPRNREATRTNMAEVDVDSASKADDTVEGKSFEGNQSETATPRQRVGSKSMKDLAAKLDLKRSLGIRSSLEGAGPELALSFLQRGSSNLTALKARLASCSDEWMSGFLDINGLELLFDHLVKLGSKGFMKFADAVDQLSCVGCIRAVMNSSIGLEYLIDSPSHTYVRTLAEGG